MKGKSSSRGGGIKIARVGYSRILCLNLVVSFLITNMGFAETGKEVPPESLWEFGGYLDLGYTLDFNFPDNHQWRSKNTTSRVNELKLNVAFAYLRRPSIPTRRWGFEFGVQTGENTKGLIGQARLQTFESDIPIIGGADVLRHFSHLNFSYLAPYERGVRLRAGLSESYIGYESFYAKENFNYTRSYMADYAPYFMFAADAQYPVRDEFTVSLYLLNGFFSLSNPSGLPSYGTQVKWSPNSQLALTGNMYYGPVQQNADPEFWRLFFDQFLKWNKDQLTLALAYDIGTEKSATTEGNPRQVWMGGAFYANWNFLRLWRTAVRPEVFWDPQGIVSGSRQLLWAVTTTLRYDLPIDRNKILLWWEYRYGRSTGSGGGFFKGGDVEPGVPGLDPDHHLLIWAVNWAFDS